MASSAIRIKIIYRIVTHKSKDVWSFIAFEGYTADTNRLNSRIHLVPVEGPEKTQTAAAPQRISIHPPLNHLRSTASLGWLEIARLRESINEKNPNTDDNTTATATGVTLQSKMTHITKSRIMLLKVSVATSMLTFRFAPIDMHPITTLKIKAMPQSGLRNGTSNCESEPN
jgi:hypothetical protein